METEILKRVQTPYIQINPEKCGGCGGCVRGCPQNVLMRVGSFWKGHVEIRDAENCIGCKRCVKTCRRKVFQEI